MDISLLSVCYEIYTVTLPLKLLKKFKFNQLFPTKVWDVIKPEIASTAVLQKETKKKLTVKKNTEKGKII